MTADDVRQAVRDQAAVFTETRPIDDYRAPTVEDLGPWDVGLGDQAVIVELFRYAYATREGRPPEDITEADLKFIAGLMHGFAIGIRAGRRAVSSSA